MQSDNNEIYKITSQRTGQSQELYKDLGNFVFKALADGMKKPKSIILKLKGLGYWYLRKSRMEVAVKMETREPLPTGIEHIDNIARTGYENRLEMKDHFRDRLVDYEKYIEVRNNVRRIRYGTDTIDDGEDTDEDQTQDNPGEPESNGSSMVQEEH